MFWFIVVQQQYTLIQAEHLNCGNPIEMLTVTQSHILSVTTDY